MSNRVFTVKFPKKTARVVARHEEPDSPLRLGCLVALGVPFDPAKVDDRTAALLGAFLDAGVRAVALEDADGPQEKSGLLGPKSNQLLKARKATLLGVDRPALITEMRVIQAEAQQWEAGHQALSWAIAGYLRAAADRIAPGPATDLFRLRLLKDGGRLSVNREASELIALERRLGRPMPPDARRFLLGFSLTDEDVPEDLTNDELDELKRRMARYTAGGVLAADAAARLPNPDAEPDARPLRLQTGAGAVVLSATEADLLRLSRKIVDAVRQNMIPVTPYDLKALKAGEAIREAGAGRGGADESVSKAVDSNQKIQHYVAETAQVLGIDLDDYPTLRRCLQQSCLGEAAAGGGALDHAQQALHKAWEHLVAAAVTTRPERQLFAAARQAWLLGKLGNLDITSDDYGDLSADLDDCRLSNVLAAVAGVGVALDPTVEAVAAEFDARRTRLLRFYDAARQRARQMAGRAAALAREAGGQALLVCLGFHVPTVQATWRAERASLLIVTPDFSGLSPSPR